MTVILGTSADMIDICEDREKFSTFIKYLNLKNEIDGRCCLYPPMREDEQNIFYLEINK